MTQNILKGDWTKRSNPNDIVHEIDKDTKAILIELKDEGEIQQAYWTIYNEGRTKGDKW